MHKLTRTQGAFTRKKSQKRSRECGRKAARQRESKGNRESARAKVKRERASKTEDRRSEDKVSDRVIHTHSHT